MIELCLTGLVITFAGCAALSIRSRIQRGLSGRALRLSQ